MNELIKKKWNGQKQINVFLNKMIPALSSLVKNWPEEGLAESHFSLFTLFFVAENQMVQCLKKSLRAPTHTYIRGTRRRQREKRDDPHKHDLIRSTCNWFILYEPCKHSNSFYVSDLTRKNMEINITMLTSWVHTLSTVILFH